MIGRDRLFWLGIFIGAALIFAGGIATGWYFYGPKADQAEQYAAPVRQKDGSMVLEKKPGASAEADAAAAKPEIQKGGKIERTVVVTVKPRAKPQPPAEPVQPNPDGTCPAAQAQECPPVTVRLDIVKVRDDVRRVVASSPDGDIVGGIDVPPAEPTMRKVPAWAAGASITQDKRWGVFLDRDVGPFRVGAEAGKAEAGGAEFRLKVGLRF